VAARVSDRGRGEESQDKCNLRPTGRPNHWSKLASA
jgi:hypothetical protein